MLAELFWRGSEAGCVAAITVIIAIPFYLGLTHVPVPQLLIYTGAAGTALAAGEYAESRESFTTVRMFVADIVGWCILIFMFGGLAYLTALIF